MRKGNLNFEKDSRSLHVNKDGCREFINPHGEMSVINVAEVVLKVKLFQYSNGWVNNSYEGKRKCIYSVQLLNLHDIRDISARADVLKACLDRFFYLIKEHCMDDKMLKKVNSICRGQSINEYRM